MAVRGGGWRRSARGTRVVQDGVDLVEDVPLGGGGFVVVGAELFERPVSDVLAAVGAVFGVGVKREELRPALRQEIRYLVGEQSKRRPF